MKKSDLKYGNVVELRNGDFYVLVNVYNESILIALTSKYHFNFDIYDKDLINTGGFENYDIIKVYKDYTCKELLWERKENPKLTEDEKVILRNLPKKYKWITRDEDRTLSFHSVNPHKEVYFWSSLKANNVSDLFPNLFKFIKWEDEEPYSIEELLKGE